MMIPVRRVAVPLLAVVSAVFLLVGCSSEPTLTGVWSAADGGGNKVITETGACTGMYYNRGVVLDIGGPESCALGSKSADGTYPLVVQQAPNEVTYRVRFDGDRMTFTSFGKQIVLTRQ